MLSESERKAMERRRRRRPGRWLVLLALLAALVAGAAFGAREVAGLLAELVGAVPVAGGVEVEPGRPVEVEVPPGASARQIGELLAAKGVIGSPLEFELAVRTRGIAAQLQAGRYELETGMGVEAALDALLAGPVVESYRVTVVEGLWVSEILETLADQTAHQVADFEAALVEGEVESSLLPEPADEVRDWEGLLFPDTYEFEEEASAAQILQRMASTMEERVASLDWSGLEELDLTVYEGIVVASLVESETKVDDERALVAGVIYNRLRQGMALEIDATVLYAVGKRGSGPTASELEVDSPYNTRRNPGLPPTPIGAPGLASLQAAARPADTGYLYYVLTDRSGRHGFAETHEEFLRLKEQARQEGVIP